MLETSVNLSIDAKNFSEMKTNVFDDFDLFLPWVLEMLSKTDSGLIDSLILCLEIGLIFMKSD